MVCFYAAANDAAIKRRMCHDSTFRSFIKLIVKQRLEMSEHNVPCTLSSCHLDHHQPASHQLSIELELRRRSEYFKDYFIIIIIIKLLVQQQSSTRHSATETIKLENQYIKRKNIHCV